MFLLFFYFFKKWRGVYGSHFINKIIYIHIILSYHTSYDIYFHFILNFYILYEAYKYFIYNPFACASSISNKISKLNADL